MTTTTATTDRTEAGYYARVIERIEALVAELNVELGLTATYPEPRNGLSFGYIGNCGHRPARNGGGAFDDRLWSIFLPHPGRVGTADDRLGAFATGDLAGARRALTELLAFAKGARFAARAAR